MAEQQAIPSYRRDYYAGALMVVLGIGVIIKGRGYDVGNLRAMGPGFFPVAVGVVMTLSGIGIALSSVAVAPAEERQQAEWRGWSCILLSVVAFVVLGSYGGLVPATFATVFLAALGDRKNSLRDAALLALGMCAIAIVVFHWGLQVQFPLFQWG